MFADRHFQQGYRGAVEHPGEDHRDHRCGTARDHRRAVRSRPRRVDDRVHAPRTAYCGQKRGSGLTPPTANPVPRRTPHYAPLAGHGPTGLGHRMGNRHTGIRRHRPPIRRAGRRQPATEHGPTHRTRPAPVRHVAYPHLPRRGVLRRSRAQPPRGIQAMVVDASNTEHRQAAQPGQHQERADQPALLPDPDHRVGLPGRADPAADVPRRSAGDRQTAAAVPRRRRRDETVARRPRGPRPVVPVDHRAPGAHRHAPRRTARPDRRRGRADRIRLLAADPDRQAAQRPLHPAAPAAEGPARRLDPPSPTQRTAHRSPSART